MINTYNLDIAFLHSDAMMIKNKNFEYDPLRWEMTLSPEIMFDQMI